MAFCTNSNRRHQQIASDQIKGFQGLWYKISIRISSDAEDAKLGIKIHEGSRYHYASISDISRHHIDWYLGKHIGSDNISTEGQAWLPTSHAL